MSEGLDLAEKGVKFEEGVKFETFRRIFQA